MKRKIYQQLLDWKLHRHGEAAILIDGARRVGKSYIAEEFGRNEYRSYILVDFNNLTEMVKEIFDNYLNQLDIFFNYLSQAYGIILYPRESLIIFDEVQLYPKARAAIKYLVKDGRYDYIETGSLVSINNNVKDIVIPSEEHRIKMFPMDFEEFLWALGETSLMPMINQCFEHLTPMGPIHRKAMELFRKYVIIGGMPQSVLKFVNSDNFSEVDYVKRDILELYKADIQKYALGNERKVKAVFDEIPGALSRHEKKFRLSDISEKARLREYESAFLWLGESMVVNLCYNSTARDMGLRLNEERTTLKCYLSDTGLLISQAFSDEVINKEKLYLKLALGKLELNKGMLIENVVAQMLRASGHDLFFFSQYSEKSKDRMELDFIIPKGNITSRHNIIPIEVKSTSDYSLISLKKALNKYAKALAQPYVLHTGDLAQDSDIIYLPLYMTPLL